MNEEPKAYWSEATQDWGGSNVTYIDASLQQLQRHLQTLQLLVYKKVLPNSRYAFTAELTQANTLVEQIAMLLERSGMSKRLGFVPNRDGTVQPVAVGPVNGLDALSAEGAGVPGGQAERAVVEGAEAAEPVLERPGG